MNPFDQKVTGDHRFLISKINDSSIIPNSLECGGKGNGEVLGKVLYQSKLPELGKISSMSVFIL